MFFQKVKIYSKVPLDLIKLKHLVEITFIVAQSHPNAVVSRLTLKTQRLKQTSLRKYGAKEKYPILDKESATQYSTEVRPKNNEDIDLIL